MASVQVYIAFLSTEAKQKKKAKKAVIIRDIAVIGVNLFFWHVEKWR